MRLILLAASLALLTPAMRAGAEEPFIQPKDKNGPLVHRYSGFSFPAQIGHFYRLSPHQFDPSGRDISVGYNLDFPRVTITVYVYPTRGTSLEQEFARRQQEVTGAHPRATLVTQGATTVSPQKVRALSAEYSYADNLAKNVQLLQSTLLVARSGEYFVEYRISHAAETTAVAAKLARQLVQGLAYP